MRRRGWLRALAVGAAALVGGLAWTSPAGAEPGRVVADVTAGDAGGVSVAFDGKHLYYTDRNGLTLHRVTPSGGERTAVPILGAPAINAITYDVTHDWFWAVDSTGLGVYILQKDGLARLRFVIEPVFSLPGLCKNLAGCSTLVTGLAYDATNDTLWYVPDRTPRVYHFNTVGDLLGYFDVDAGAAALTPDCLANTATGIAAGAGSLYITAGTCAQAFRYSKSDASGAAKIAGFPQGGASAADAECDSISFTVDVMWVRDTRDGHIRAVEVPPATCYYGGGVKLDYSKRWMTGGGQLAFTTPTGEELPLAHGFHILCDQPFEDQPNNLSVTWKDPDGNNHRFHMTQVIQSDCLSTGNPSPPDATFNRLQGEGTGRLDGKQVGHVYFIFDDNGEPGNTEAGGTDTGEITINNVTGGEPGDAVIIGCFGCPSEGNHQAHR